MSIITNATYANSDHSSISVDFDGLNLGVPVDLGNRHYAEIVEQEIEIAPYVEPVPTWQENRISAYGSWNQQLDIMYWDGVNGTSVWADHIATVKAAHPKPT